LPSTLSNLCAEGKLGIIHKKSVDNVVGKVPRDFSYEFFDEVKVTILAYEYFEVNTGLVNHFILSIKILY
jgi:hypothetical protein